MKPLSVEDGNLDEMCKCGHTAERHSGGYGDCMIVSGCDCRGFDVGPAKGVEDGTTMTPHTAPECDHRTAIMSRQIEERAWDHFCSQCGAFLYLDGVNRGSVPYNDNLYSSWRKCQKPTKGVEDGISDEGQWIVSAKVIHPDYLKQIEHELWQIGGAFAEIKVENKPAVPVEERTAELCTACHKPFDSHPEPGLDCYPHGTFSTRWSPPIPEERTAEMAPDWLTDDMFHEMRKLIADVQFLTFIGHPIFDTAEEFKKKLGSRAEAMTEAIKAAQEGKAKAEEVQE